MGRGGDGYILVHNKGLDIGNELIVVPQNYFDNSIDERFLKVYLYLFARAAPGCPTLMTVNKIYNDLNNPAGVRIQAKQLHYIYDAISRFQADGFMQTDLTDNIRQSDAFEYTFTDKLAASIEANKTRYSVISLKTFNKILNSNFGNYISKDILYRLYLTMRTSMTMQSKGRKQLGGEFLYGVLAAQIGHHRNTVASAIEILQDIGIYKVSERELVKANEMVRTDKTYIVDLTYINWRTK